MSVSPIFHSQIGKFGGSVSHWLRKGRRGVSKNAQGRRGKIGRISGKELQITVVTTGRVKSEIDPL